MRYQKSFYLLGLSIFIVILPFSHTGGFYAPSGGYVHGFNISNTTINVNTTVNYTKQNINFSNNYLIGLFGNDYYLKYIKFSSYNTINKTTTVNYNYMLPMKNGTILQDNNSLFSSNNTIEKELSIITIVKNNKTLYYFGPNKAYYLNITAKQALNISNKYGFNATLDGIQPIYENYSKNYTYYLVWKVINNTYYYPRLTNTTEYYSKLYKGIYVDINNGSIVGEFLYSPTKTVQSYQNNITGVAGIFSLFPLSIYNSTVQKLPSGYNSTVLLQFNPNYLLIEMVFIVTVIIVIVAFIIFRYLMHHK